MTGLWKVETYQPQTGDVAHCQISVFRLQVAGSNCTQSNWRGVPGLQTGPKRYLRPTPQPWAGSQSSSTPKKLVVWGHVWKGPESQGKAEISHLWWKRRCGEKNTIWQGKGDKGCCQQKLHCWWWPLRDGCWSTVFRKPSGVGHFDLLPRAAMAVIWAPKGFLNSPLLIAMLLCETQHLHCTANTALKDSCFTALTFRVAHLFKSAHTSWTEELFQEKENY